MCKGKHDSETAFAKDWGVKLGGSLSEGRNRSCILGCVRGTVVFGKMFYGIVGKVGEFDCKFLGIPLAGPQPQPALTEVTRSLGAVLDKQIPAVFGSSAYKPGLLQRDTYCNSFPVYQETPTPISKCSMVEMLMRREAGRIVILRGGCTFL